MRINLIFGTAAILTLAMGCEPQPQTNGDGAAFARHLPDSRILVDVPEGANRAIGATADTYLTTVQVSTDVNGMISSVLDAVSHVTEFEPSYSDDQNRYLWGPWNDGGLDPNQTALYVEYDEVEDAYGWAIVLRDKDSTNDDDWVPVIAGEAHEGANDDEGSGFFIVDFDAMALMNPAETGSGTFVSTYDTTADAVEAEAAFENFTSEEAETPVTASYRYGQDATGAGHMDLAYLADIGEDNSLDELIVMRSRWHADGSGRGDMVIVDGDLGPLAFQASECWDTDFAVSYEVNNFEFLMEGDETSCAFDQPEWNDDAPDPS